MGCFEEERVVVAANQPVEGCKLCWSQGVDIPGGNLSILPLHRQLRSIKGCTMIVKFGNGRCNPQYLEEAAQKRRWDSCPD